MALSISGRIENISKTLRRSASPRTVFGDVVYGPGGSCGPRVQQDFQLVAVIEGVADVRVEGAVSRIRPGEVGLFLPGKEEGFRFSAERTTHHTWCAVYPDNMPADLRGACMGVPVVLPMTQRLVQLIELGPSAPREAGTRAPGLLDSLGLAAMHEFVFGAENKFVPDEPDALRRALDWIGQNLSKPASLSVLARAAGVSTAQLVKLFRRHLDVTPMRALWTARTEQGVRLLRETGLTVSEVAYHCGFATPFHFSRWVRKLYGVSPRAFRAEAWSGAELHRRISATK